jgi:organic radical activating enzyme
MIIHNRDDFRFAEQQAQKVSPNCKLYLQPEWSKREKMMPLIVDYVMENTQWIVSLQTHKYLNIP